MNKGIITGTPTKILYFRHAWKKIFPLGAVYLMDYIKKTCTNVEQKLVDLTLIAESERQKAIINEITEFNPDIIAFSWRDVSIFLPSTEADAKTLKLTFKSGYSKKISDLLYAAKNYYKSRSEYNSLIKGNLSYLNMIKKRFPNKTLVVGGTAFSAYGEYIIKNCADGTIGIVGEGEEILRKIVCREDISQENVLIKQNNTVIRGKFNSTPVDIEHFTGVNFEYIETAFPDMKSYFDDDSQAYIGVQTKRGCNKNCIFCKNSYLEGKKIRYRNPEAVISDIKTLNQKYGVKKIWFADSQFILSDKCIKNNSIILEGIIKNNLKIEWSSYIRIENVTEDFCKLLVESGLTCFELSINSGSQKNIDFLKLGFKLENIYEKCQMLKDAGFDQKMLLNYTLNIPGETKETLKETIASYRRIQKIFGEDKVIPEVYFLGVVDDTELEHYLIKTGFMPQPDRDNPLKLNMKSAKYSIHNPPPFDKILAKLFLEAFDNNVPTGKYVMDNLESRI